MKIKSKTIASYIISLILVITAMTLCFFGLSSASSDEISPADECPLSIQELRAFCKGTSTGDLRELNCTLDVICQIDGPKLTYIELELFILDEFFEAIKTKDGKESIVIRHFIDEGLYAMAGLHEVNVSIDIRELYEDNAINEFAAIKAQPFSVLDSDGGRWQDDAGQLSLTSMLFGKPEYRFSNQRPNTEAVSIVAKITEKLIEQGTDLGDYQYYENPSEYCVFRFKNCDIRFSFMPYSDKLEPKRISFAIYLESTEGSITDRAQPIIDTADIAKTLIKTVYEHDNTASTNSIGFEEAFTDINLVDNRHEAKIDKGSSTIYSAAMLEQNNDSLPIEAVFWSLNIAKPELVLSYTKTFD